MGLTDLKKKRRRQVEDKKQLICQQKNEKLKAFIETFSIICGMKEMTSKKDGSHF